MRAVGAARSFRVPVRRTPSAHAGTMRSSPQKRAWSGSGSPCSQSAAAIARRELGRLVWWTASGLRLAAHRRVERGRARSARPSSGFRQSRWQAHARRSPVRARAGWSFEVRGADRAIGGAQRARRTSDARLPHRHLVPSGRGHSPSWWKHPARMGVFADPTWGQRDDSLARHPHHPRARGEGAGSLLPGGCRDGGRGSASNPRLERARPVTPPPRRPPPGRPPRAPRANPPGTRPRPQALLHRHPVREVLESRARAAR